MVFESTDFSLLQFDRPLVQCSRVYCTQLPYFGNRVSIIPKSQHFRAGVWFISGQIPVPLSGRFAVHFRVSFRSTSGQVPVHFRVGFRPASRPVFGTLSVRLSAHFRAVFTHFRDGFRHAFGPGFGALLDWGSVYFRAGLRTTFGPGFRPLSVHRCRPTLGLVFSIIPGRCSVNLPAGFRHTLGLGSGHFRVGFQSTFGTGFVRLSGRVSAHF